MPINKPSIDEWIELSTGEIHKAYVFVAGLGCNWLSTHHTFVAPHTLPVAKSATGGPFMPALYDIVFMDLAIKQERYDTSQRIRNFLDRRCDQ